MTTNVLNTKINTTEHKISNHEKYITTPEFNKLLAESSVAKSKQTNFVTKTDFDKNLKNLNRRITSSKTKLLQVQKKRVV